MDNLKKNLMDSMLCRKLYILFYNQPSLLGLLDSCALYIDKYSKFMLYKCIPDLFSLRFPENTLESFYHNGFINNHLY